MKSELFSNFIQKPQSLSSHHTGDLESIIKEYPYFQSARAIHLKALKNNDSSNYNDALKVTAAYTTDRSILFDFITSDGFRQNEISQHIKKHYENIKDLVVSSENVSVKKSIAIDDALKQQVSESVNILDPDLFQPKVEKSKIVSFKLNQEEEIKEQDQTSKSSSNPTPEELLNLGAPLQFDFKEKHSFNEWLKLTKFKPIERKNDPGTSVESEDSKSLSENDKRQNKFKLIEKFLDKNPKLKPTKDSTKNVNLAEEQMIQPEALMTETLARIYVEQKNFKKAIQSYKILSLKYPEKSGFFADRIKAVKQLQEQNKKE